MFVYVLQQIPKRSSVVFMDYFIFLYDIMTFCERERESHD